MSVTTDEEIVTRRRVDWATVPRVNLLPPEILQARSLSRTKRAMGGAVVACVAIGALGALWGHQQVSTARDGLALVQSRSVVLQAEQAKYAEVPRTLSQLEAAQAARQKAMSNDVLWYRFLDELAADTPNGVLLSSMQVTLSEGQAAVATDALTPSGHGSVQVQGEAKVYSDVSSWLTSVVRVTGMEISRLQTAGRSASGATTEPIKFTADVLIGDTALSHRYDRKAG